MLEENPIIPEKPLTHEVNTTTSGTMLMAARQARGLELSEVAAKLKLSSHWIEGMESDNYHHLGARVYLRGYIRSYAKLLEINSDVVLRAFDKVYDAAHEKSEKPTAIHQPMIEHVRSHKHMRHMVRWGAVALGAVMILLVILWWHDQRTIQSAPQVNLPAQQQTADDQSVVVPSPVQQQAQQDAPKVKPTASVAVKKNETTPVVAKSAPVKANYTVSKVTQ